MLGVCVVISIINAAALVKYYHIHPQKEFEFNPHRQSDDVIGINISPAYSGLPEEAKTKIRLINNVRLPLGFGVFFLFLYYFFEYMEDPKNHWFNDFKKWCAKIERRIKEDEERGGGR
jgi:hypothetical protein